MNASSAPLPGDAGWAGFLAYLEQRHSLVRLSEIGKGGMGRVYRAWDEDLNRWVAVKVLDSAAATPESLHRFRQESQILGSLKHPAIVGVHAAKTSPDGVAYFIMDFVAGGDLGARIAQRRAAGSPFSVAEVIHQLRPVADALDTIHRMRPQVIHRDVKPANILVPDQQSSWNTSILTDFGISLAQDTTRLTSVGFLIGTDRYMAPEQFRAAVDGGPPPGDSIDRYAFALIIFEMLTLRAMRDMMSQEAWRFARRFPGLPPQALAAVDRPATQQITAVLARALDDDPGRRYPTATAVLTALETAMRQPSVAQTTPVTQPPRSSRGSRTAGSPVKKWLISTLSLLMVVVLGVGGYVWVDNSRHPSWSGAQAAMVEAFPDLLPARENDEGWLGMSCSGATAQEGEQARIVCRNDGSSMVVADFGDSETRDLRGAASEMETLQDASGECVIRTGRVNQGTSGVAYVALPQAEGKDRYSVLLSSTTAETDIVTIPVC
ncbi:serine/threonine-protein kinase [Corynebacterium terpenotabidum]|uniref:non-specific serine/threonine protein kinase n=1 Tax=Corynebacterium terpenotabidum Y-11 TaxID=1200352 RepID=S4XFV4_9CORY|nr:serine/threonine-protein kinase [Corynebacterium terpenotabidum]AGP31436.1 serine/threonine protein kinase [Corynebacterium terpenotabidum Y-11]